MRRRWAWLATAALAAPALGDDARPDSHHAPGWPTDHGAEARGTDCAGCHEPDACGRCHAGDVPTRPPHPAGYLILHGGDVGRTTADCAPCHAVQTFCAGCHAATGVGSLGAPPAAVAHPASWLDPAALGNHAHEAQRDLGACVACHSEGDCVACHRVVTPHDAAFVDDCGDAWARAPQMCGTCHTLVSRTPPDALDRRCRR